MASGNRHLFVCALPQNPRIKFALGNCNKIYLRHRELIEYINVEFLLSPNRGKPSHHGKCTRKCWQGVAGLHGRADVHDFD